MKNKGKPRTYAPHWALSTQRIFGQAHQVFAPQLVTANAKAGNTTNGRESLCEISRNTTHGSGWIVQVRPTRRAALPFLEYHPREWVGRSGAAYQTAGPPFLGIPPTWVGGSFRCGLPDGRPSFSWNPTHVSGWIVQVRPTRRAALPFLESHPR